MVVLLFQSKALAIKDQIRGGIVSVESESALCCADSFLLGASCLRHATLLRLLTCAFGITWLIVLFFNSTISMLQYWY